MPRLHRAALFAALLAWMTPIPGLASIEGFYGTASIDVVRGYGIGVAFDERSSTEEPDGVFERLFILEMAGLIPEELPIWIDDARMLVREDGLVVFARTGSLALGFFMNPEAERSLLDALALARGDQEQSAEALFTYRGFGFSRTTGEWSTPLDQSWFGPPPTEATCSSGGVGSTSCSQTCGSGVGCSTTCASGYYACCKCGAYLSAKCICVANPSSGGGGGGTGGSGGGGGGGSTGGGGGTGWGGGGGAQCTIPAETSCAPECIRCIYAF